MNTNNYQLMNDYFEPTIRLVVNNHCAKYQPLQNISLKAPVIYAGATFPSVKRSLIVLIVLMHVLVFTSITQYYQQSSSSSSAEEPSPMIVSLIHAAKKNLVETNQSVDKKQAKALQKIISKTTEKPSLIANQVSEVAQKAFEPAEKKSEYTIVAESVTSTEQKVSTESVFEPPRFNADYLHNPTPEYPGLSRRRGEQGRVTLKVLVNTNGEPESVQLDKSSGFELLDRAALNAVKNWKFIPAKSNHQSVLGTVIVPVRFSLDS